MGTFYSVHTKAVEISLLTASKTLKNVSPQNLFVKKWYHTKVRTKTSKSWSLFETMAIPNLNDLVSTFFFVLSKIFIWLLKLIYSCVYHLTYVFAGVTAILYFLGWTKDALKGTVQASLWCVILPFVIVAILALVGNSIDERASVGQSAFSSIDNLVWLFGVTLLLLVSPMITHGMIKGGGVHSVGAKMGTMVINSGTHALTMAPMLMNSTQFARNKIKSGSRGIGRINNRLSERLKEIREVRSQSSSNSSNLRESSSSNTRGGNSVESKSFGQRETRRSDNKEKHSKTQSIHSKQEKIKSTEGRTNNKSINTHSKGRQLNSRDTIKKSKRKTAQTYKQQKARSGGKDGIR